VAEVDIADVAGAVLIDAAREAATNAYAPYSRFGVGAALLLDDGTVIAGANLENASYGLSLCAEAVALATANTAGRLRDVVAIGLIGGRITPAGLTGEEVVRPCGRCRQMLVEAGQLGGRDIAVYCASADGGASERHLLSELLPFAFGPDDLGLQ
jgi:cytidine deaminase